MTTSTTRPAGRATYREIFAVREFRALFASFAMFMLGETGRTLALSVLLYQRTGSPLLAALGYAAGLLPYALGGFLLLSLADRLPPRALIVGYDLLRCAVAVVLALGVLPPPAMLVLVTVVALFGPVSGAARMALLPDLLGGDAYVLARSTFTVVSGGSQVLGFAVGGVLLAAAGPSGLLWLTAATCAGAALLVRFGLVRRPGRAPSAGGTVRQTWHTNRLLLADRRVRGLLLAQWLPGSLMVGAEGVVVPYAAGLPGGAGAGVLFMATAAGMLAGDLVVGRLLTPARRERLTPWLAVLLGVPLLVFAARPGLAVGAVLLALAASGFGYHLGLARRFLDAVPEARRGQAFGLSSAGLMVAQGLAASAAGGLAEAVAPGLVMALAGVASLAATGACRRSLAVRPQETGATRPAGDAAHR